MGREPRLLRRLVGRLVRVQVRLERDLAVHHHLLLAGQVHHQVGTERAALDVHPGLLGEVAAVHHARQLDHPAELDLAPAPAGVGGPERADQALGLLAERILRLGEGAELGPQRALRPLAALVQLGELSVDLLQRLAQRRHQDVDGGGARVELDLCHLLRLLQLGLRVLDEALGVGLQRVVRERLEPLGELLLRRLDQVQLLVHRPAAPRRGRPARRRGRPGRATGPPRAPRPGRSPRRGRAPPLPDSASRALSRSPSTWCEASSAARSLATAAASRARPSTQPSTAAPATSPPVPATQDSSMEAPYGRGLTFRPLGREAGPTRPPGRARFPRGSGGGKWPRMRTKRALSLTDARRISTPPAPRPSSGGGT